MSKSALIKIVVIFFSLVLLAGVIYQLPPVNQRLAWRVDFALAYLRGVVNPIGEVPTPLPPPAVAVTNQVVNTPTTAPTLPPAVTDTPGPTPTSPPTATPIPATISLSAPGYEKQDINNCGPASLAMYLRYYGWEGDQFNIANLLKPQREDRNVNVEELTFYARTNAGWLNTEYRVGGDLELLKQFLAAGLPVMIEESFYFEEPYWPNDDLWAAHYNLLTGFDENTQTFTGQDSFYGPDQTIDYQTLEEYWHAFNHVYILIYPPTMEETVKSILGEDWDVEVNRQKTMEMAQAETQSNPTDAYAWFNLGTNLVYFERYQEAAQAFDEARELGLPQRMLRYQFTPFFAYFHTRRIEDLLALTEYALQITPNAEEALLWHGWALYRSGDTNGAIADFRAALAENPNYPDAQYALDFVRENP
ncbi:MAG: C39 family peptidase [Anaerolineales bacterium]|nr:C39 family peptidase [Anaerolineales bacterium]